MSLCPPGARPGHILQGSAPWGGEAGGEGRQGRSGGKGGRSGGEGREGPTGGRSGREPQRLTFGLGLAQDAQHLRVGGVLAQRPQHVPTLRVGDLHLPSRGSVKQRKGLFELCREKTPLSPLGPGKAVAGG